MIDCGSRSSAARLSRYFLDRAAKLQSRRNGERELDHGRDRTAASAAGRRWEAQGIDLGQDVVPALEADVERLQARDEVRPPRVVRSGLTSASSELHSRSRRAPVRASICGEIVVALQMCGRISSPRGCRSGAGIELREQHRQVLRPAEARIAAFAVQHHADFRRGLAEQERVGHRERIADRVAEQADRLVEVVQAPRPARVRRCGDRCRSAPRRAS